MHSLISPSDYRNKDFETKDIFSDEEIEVLQKNCTLIFATFKQRNTFVIHLFNQQVGLVSFVPSKGASPDKMDFMVR